jgi:CHAD domain-containing protein
MAFEFKKKESVRKAVKRLGRKRIDKAFRDLKYCERLEAVHEVRKEIKQLRALLRLVRPAMAQSDYRRFSDALREASGRLGAARDAHVKVNALAELSEHFKQELAPRSFRELKGFLAAGCRQRQAELSRTKAPRKVGCLLKKLSGQIASVRVKGSGWSALAPGVKRSYRDGRRGYQLAYEAGTPERFHKWRKRVKDLYYQIGLLHRIWPEQMAAAETELKHLGRCLGDDHDLVMLTEAAATKRFRKQATEEVEALKALADKRQDELRAEALALGSRFYKEKPSVFCKRLGRYWKRWRREPKRKVRAS